MSGAVVVDLSFALKSVITEPFTWEADELLAEWQAAGLTIIAPSLFGYEATNALYRKRPPLDWRIWLQGSLADVLAPVTLIPPTPALLNRAAEIAGLLGQSAAYDAQYAALAEAEDCELWTADERFWRAAQQHFPWTHWVGERAAATR